MTKRTLQNIASEARYPVSAILELTYKCNWDCKYCYAVSGKGKPLSFSDWVKILGGLEEISTLMLTLTGGEPLLHSEFFEIAEHARKRGFALNIYTNGTLLNNNNIDRFAALNPLRVDLSIHGADSRTHDFFTCRKGSFSKLLESLDLLKSRDIAVLLKCAVTRLNQDQLIKIKQIADDRSINIAFDTVIQSTNDGSFDPLDYSVTKEFRREYWSEKFDAITSGGGREPVDWSSVDNICGAGKKSITVNPYGDVLPCPQWNEVLGNALEVPVKEILDSSDKLQDVRTATSQLVGILRNMPCGKYCNACPGASLSQTGSTLEPTKQALDNAEARMWASEEFGRKFRNS